MKDKSFWALLLILAAALVGAYAIKSRPVPVVVETNLERLPMRIGPYAGVSDSFSDAVYEELNADKHVYRHYYKDDGTRVDLYVGYYGTAKGGRTGHNPYACLPGAGWGIIADERIDIKVAGGRNETQENVRVNSLVAQRNDEFSVMLHWYQSERSKVISTGLQQNLERLIGRVVRNRNDGAYVQITMLVDEAGIEQAKREGVLFAREVVPLLARYWPVER